MYQVTALQNATMPKQIGDPHTHDNWKAGDVDYVDNDLIHLYKPHTDVFTINQEWNGALTTGVAAVSGLSAVTLNASSAGVLSLGTTTAASTTLDGTQADLLPSTGFTSSATINVAGTAVSNALSTSAQFDGTTTAKSLF